MHLQGKTCVPEMWTFEQLLQNYKTVCREKEALGRHIDNLAHRYKMVCRENRALREENEALQVMRFDAREDVQKEAVCESKAASSSKPPLQHDRLHECLMDKTDKINVPQEHLKDLGWTVPRSKPELEVKVSESQARQDDMIEELKKECETFLTQKFQMIQFVEIDKLLQELDEEGKDRAEGTEMGPPKIQEQELQEVEESAEETMMDLLKQKKSSRWKAFKRFITCGPPKIQEEDEEVRSLRTGWRRRTYAQRLRMRSRTVRRLRRISLQDTKQPSSSFHLKNRSARWHRG